MMGCRGRISAAVAVDLLLLENLNSFFAQCETSNTASIEASTSRIGQSDLADGDCPLCHRAGRAPGTERGKLQEVYRSSLMSSTTPTPI